MFSSTIWIILAKKLIAKNGGNLGEVNKYNTQVIDENFIFFYDENVLLQLNDKVEQKLKGHYYVSFKGRIGLIKRIMQYWLKTAID